MKVNHGQATHVGHRRQHNEDSYAAEYPLFIVADGMGGHSRGDVASYRVVANMAACLPSSEFVSAPELDHAISQTTRVLSDFGMSQGNPGSTMTGLVVSTHRGLPCVRVFNIGDSRTYLLSEGEFSQVTTDHSEFQELMDSGVGSINADGLPGRKNVLTKALGAGFSPSIPVDQFVIPACSADRYIMCSDGLSGEVNDEAIERVARTISDPQQAADELIHQALNNGGKDNITVIVVDLHDVQPSWDSTADQQTGEPNTSAECASEDTLPSDRVIHLRAIARQHFNGQNLTEGEN